MRLIDADYLLKRILNIHYFDNQDEDVFWSEVVEAPTVDAKPIIHAKWEVSDTILGKCCRCSNCNSLPANQYNYCPYCGASMDLEGEET